MVKVVYEEVVYEVGDIVTIREWDDMAAEFGTAYNGNKIMTSPVFNEKMGMICGMQVKIKYVYGSKSGRFYHLDLLGADDGNNGDWAYTSDMFEREAIDEEYMPTTSDLLGIISFNHGIVGCV